MDIQAERQCRVTGAVLHQNNSTLCPFLTDITTSDLLPVMPGLTDRRQQRFGERELESELYQRDAKHAARARTARSKCGVIENHIAFRRIGKTTLFPIRE